MDLVEKNHDSQPKFLVNRPTATCNDYGISRTEGSAIRAKALLPSVPFLEILARRSLASFSPSPSFPNGADQVGFFHGDKTKLNSDQISQMQKRYSPPC